MINQVESKNKPMENILEKINRSGLKLLEPSSTLENTYAIIVKEAIKLVNADHGSILLEEKGELKRVYASHPYLYKIKTRKKANTYRAFKERKVIVLPISQTYKAHPEAVEIGVQYTIFIPLAYQHKSIGVLTIVSTKDKSISEGQIRVLKLFGSMATLAIKKMQLYNELKETLENRDLFISMAAHELRTPLTTLRGYAQLLYNKTANDDTVEARWVREMNAESIRLTILLNDLLEINRIRTGSMHYIWKECSLLELIQRIINNFEINFPQRKLVFENNLGKKSDLVVGDFDKLMQVIINLLDNAVKFSSEREIVISLDLKSPYFILRVKDWGKGIAKRDLPKVFEGFYKGDRNSTEGMGLGLYLAKNIIEEHRGSIHIHSRVNKGTLVEVHLPRIKM